MQTLLSNDLTLKECILLFSSSLGREWTRDKVGWQRVREGIIKCSSSKLET